MAIDNNVTITGNTTREPELRYTTTGQPVANFGVAVNRRWQNRQTQEWEEAVSFIDITAWGDLAENTAESVAKGTRVTITGRLDQRSWETNEGDKRSKVEIVAEDIAPSLRWATAKIIKTIRDKDTTQNTDSDKPKTSEAPQGKPYDPDEEPF